jgi:hypothetical protein
VLLLGTSAVSAQGMKNDEAPGRTPSAQQNAPAEKVASALTSGQRKAPETTGQAAEPESDKKQVKTQKMDKDAPAAPRGQGIIRRRWQRQREAEEHIRKRCCCGFVAEQIHR